MTAEYSAISIVIEKVGRERESCAPDDHHYILNTYLSNFDQSSPPDALTLKDGRFLPPREISRDKKP